MHLLDIASEAVEIVRANDVPLRDLRQLHKYPAEQHVSEVQKILRRRQGLDRANDFDPVREVAPDDDEPTAPQTGPNLARITSAVRRLGSTPAGILESLRLALRPEDFRALADLVRQSEAHES